jgi:hypothetical protein
LKKIVKQIKINVKAYAGKFKVYEKRRRYTKNTLKGKRKKKEGGSEGWGPRVKRTKLKDGWF